VWARKTKFSVTMTEYRFLEFKASADGIISSFGTVTINFIYQRCDSYLSLKSHLFMVLKHPSCCWELNRTVFWTDEQSLGLVTINFNFQVAWHRTIFMSGTVSNPAYEQKKLRLSRNVARVKSKQNSLIFFLKKIIFSEKFTKIQEKRFDYFMWKISIIWAENTKCSINWYLVFTSLITITFQLRHLTLKFICLTNFLWSKRKLTQFFKNILK
jgi:hypothetical protein